MKLHQGGKRSAQIETPILISTNTLHTVFMLDVTRGIVPKGYTNMAETFYESAQAYKSLLDQHVYPLREKPSGFTGVTFST